jgi:hypothetical protein
MCLLLVLFFARPLWSDAYLIPGSAYLIPGSANLIPGWAAADSRFAPLPEIAGKSSIYFTVFAAK